MKRWGDEHVAAIAKAFVGSDFAQAWSLLGASLRSAVIDSLIINEMRVADSVDSTIALTAGEIVAFRGDLEAALAAGVKRRNAPPICFTVRDHGGSP